MPLYALTSTRAHREKIWSLSWHPSGELLASSSADRTISLWDVVLDPISCIFSERLQSEQHKRSIRCISFSPSGHCLVSCGFDGQSILWEYSKVPLFRINENEEKKLNSNWVQVGVLEGHENEVKSIAWSRLTPQDTYYLATCGRDKSIWIWEINSLDLSADCVAVLQEHTQDIKCVVWHPTQFCLASCSADDSIKLWRENKEYGEWTCSGTLLGHIDTVSSIAFLSSGNCLVSAGADGMVKLWNIDEPCCICSINISARPLYSIAVAPILDFIAVVGGDDLLYILQKDKNGDMAVVESSAGHLGDLNCVAWHPNSSILATGGDDATIRIWSYTS